MNRLKFASKAIKVMGLAALLILLFTIAFYFTFRDSNKLVQEMVVNRIQYDASKEIDAAMTRFNSDKQKAGIITGVETDDNVIALTFDGLADRETMKKIVALLKDNNLKATFFVPGIKAAEDSEAVKIIANNSQKIGNYTLAASKDILNDTQADQIENFCRTNVVLNTITGNQPTLLKCNVTQYSEAILESAYASSLNHVVLSNEYLSYQSFSTYEMTANYIKNLKKGSVVSIKLQGTLDEDEYSQSTQPVQAATDVAPMKTDADTAKISDDEQLVQVVEWLAKALKDNNEKTVFVDELSLSTPKNSSSQGGQNVQSTMTAQAAAFIGTSSGNVALSAVASNNATGNKGAGNQKNDETIQYPDFNKMIAENDGEKVEVINHLYTSEKGVVFTFRGISNEAVLENVLDQLDALGDAKATFFVTADELQKYPERVKEIIERGHDIGNGGVTQDSRIQNLSTEAVCKEIYRCDFLLKKMGIETTDYMPGYGFTAGNIREAVSVMNLGSKKYHLITYSVSMVRNSFSEKSAAEIVETCLPTDIYKSLKRGDIAYFRMDSTVFGNNNVMVANLVNLVAENYVYNGYVSVCVKSTEEDSIYETRQLPLDFELMTLAHMINTFEDPESGVYGQYAIQDPNDEIAAGKVSPAMAEQMIYSDYIGNPSVTGANLKGFSDTTGIDVSGKINTNGKKVIFLTFDDWGGDPVVMSILNVLEKHQVKASFFVIAKNIDVNQESLPEDERISPNPNLLREMALRGHDIGSHDYFHMHIDIDDDLTQQEELQNELIKSNRALSMVIGDLSQPQLYFRPPTLAVSKSGLQMVFETGYKKSISGDFSVHDYGCTSAQQVFNTLEYGDGTAEIGNGSIVVMHMNDQSGYTAEGLDRFLTENENKPEGERYEFAKLSDYLGNEQRQDSEQGQ